MDSGGAERVRRHAERQLQIGLRRVSVWVPARDMERLRDIAAHLRFEAGLAMTTDNQPLARRVQVPTVETRHPSGPTVFLEVGIEELGIHMLLRANGGTWRGHRGLWEVPAGLPTKLGLTRIRPARSGG